MNDTALGDTTAPAPTPAGGVFGDPNAVHTHDDGAHERPARSWTIADILESAKLPEKYARVCLRGDLQARHDQLVAELSTMVDPNGQVLGDPDAPLGGETKESRAVALSVELEQVEQEMRDAMWFPLFRGLSQDKLSVFHQAHFPKKVDARGNPTDAKEAAEYNARLIVECAVEPAMTLDEVKQLRSTLGSKAYRQLWLTANEVCTQGGVDAGKSPAFLRSLQEQ